MLSTELDVLQGLQALTETVINVLQRSCVHLITLLLALRSPYATDISLEAAQTQYLLGLGIGDITGPVVETNMMGYASMAQTDTGLHMRQRSRAFIVADALNPDTRVVFINADIAMGDSGIRRSIVQILSDTYPGLYSDHNVALVGTHQHSGVGGYLENLLPQITALGYVNQTAQAIITGTVKAVQEAHNSLALGRLKLGNTTILDANINRSPGAYLANPQEERDRYEFDQDKEMSVLRFEDLSGKPRGFLSFFPVHGTSIYENNTLVSTDNKGMAAFLYESMVEPYTMPGNNTFVAGFVQSNVGDTSPNVLGAYCESPGQPWDGESCDFFHSTCGNMTQDCHGRGPGYLISDFESNRIIGERQLLGAKTVMEGKLDPVNGPVKFVHAYTNAANYSFALENGTTVKTCPAAMGYSFAGGTSDGPGAFDFIQGHNTSDKHNPFWEIVKGAITPAPSEEQKACQEPKPILLNTGHAHTPYEWAPSSVNIQLFRVGNFVVLVVPAEFTTMAGRRLREAVRAKLIADRVLGGEAYVVIAGPANVYAHYVTTREEYAVQRYEGASTLFGPYTLEAFIHKYTRLVPYLHETNLEVPESDAPPTEQVSKAISLQTGVIIDLPPFFSTFGKVITDVGAGPYSANQTVSVQFVGANPRNNLRLEGTFLTVDFLTLRGGWRTVRTDSHPSTIFQWNRTSTVLGTSTSTISWTIEPGTPPGRYRLTYLGDAKSIGGSISSFVGTSSTFTVI